MHQLHIPIKWRNTKLCSLVIAKCLLGMAFILWLWLVFVGVPEPLIDRFKKQAEQKFKANIEIGSLKLHYHLGGWHADDVHLSLPLPYKDDLTLEVSLETISWKGRWLSREDFTQRARLKLGKANIKLTESKDKDKNWQLAKQLDLILIWDIAQDEFQLDLQAGKVLDINCRHIIINGGLKELLKDNSETAVMSANAQSTLKPNTIKKQDKSLIELLSLYELYFKKWQLAQKEISLQGSLELLSFKEAKFKTQGILFAQDWLMNNESLFSKGYCQFSGNETSFIIEEISIQQNSKELQAQAELDLVNKKINLQIKSDLGISSYIDDFFADKSPWNIKGIQQENLEIQADASWEDISQLMPSHYTVKGSVSLENGYLDDLPFNSLTTQFHFKDNQGILQDLTLVAQDEKGVLTYLIGPEQAQYKLESSLNFAWSQLLLKPFSFKHYLDAFADTKASKVQLTAEGSRYLQKNIWQTQMDFKAKNIEYLDLKLSELKSSMVFSQDEALYNEVLLAVSPSDEQASQPYMEKTWHQFCKIDQVSLDRNTHMYHIKGLEGQIFPRLLISALTQSPADYLDDYQFNKPPYIQFNGLLGVDAKSDWLAQITHDQEAQIQFGSMVLPIEQLKVNISRKQQELKVFDLEAKLWEGDVTGTAKVHLPDYSKQVNDLSWRANLKAQNVTAASLNEYFNFTTAATGEGLINANLQLYNTSEKSESLLGNGYIEYKEGSLFAVPIFGPISTILSKMTGSKNMGYQQSTRSNASLSIVNNRIYVQRLDLRTNSFKFQGDGIIELESPYQSEIVISTETRGLLNILKYPLTPLTKFLTFKGSGALKEIKWGISPLNNTSYAIESPLLPSMQEFTQQNQKTLNKTSAYETTISN